MDKRGLKFDYVGFLSELTITWERNLLRISPFFVSRILSLSLCGPETTSAMSNSYFRRILVPRDEEGEVHYSATAT